MRVLRSLVSCAALAGAAGFAAPASADDQATAMFRDLADAPQRQKQRSPIGGLRTDCRWVGDACDPNAAQNALPLMLRDRFVPGTLRQHIDGSGYVLAPDRADREPGGSFPSPARASATAASTAFGTAAPTPADCAPSARRGELWPSPGPAQPALDLDLRNATRCPPAVPIGTAIDGAGTH